MLIDNNSLFALTEFRKIWKSDIIESEVTEIKDFLQDSPLLVETLSLRNSSLAIIDLKSMTYLCCIGDTVPICGWDKQRFLDGGVGFFLSKMLPADLEGFRQMSEITTNHVRSLSDEAMKSFKSFIDLQFVGQDGNVNRVLHEGVSLKRDSDGNISFMLALISNITNLKRDNRQHLRLSNASQNLIFEINNIDNSCRQLERLSDRELQIARLTGKKLTSEEIAKALFISVHTVNTHRQNMLRKLDMTDTMELLNFLTSYQLI
ncbi:LuxR C-terminal-related transcriptional regulator [Dyadobacter sp. CY261]|uniref:helix-turn-helix transcriptional regulator n=1 Tax=Dyadobacter sp. CY261 TaxID=2907203 RepID=UPI001F3A3920|nr:LuxR C-terminal-related transcriptional regulator [Dyadobacter sp. CY261]MCF0075074.1 LuxR C-terminal-related transcriptional regulator [Dyadobacter sp. CY261]